MQRLGYFPGDIALCREDILEVVVIVRRPQVPLGGNVDELDGDPNLVAGLAHATFQDVVDVQFASYVGDAFFLPLVLHDRSAGDDVETWNPGESGYQFFSQPLREVLVFRMSAEVVERQDRKARFLRDGWRGLIRCRLMCFPGDAECGR